MEKWKTEVVRVTEEKRREEKRREEKRREEKKKDQKEKVSEERRSKRESLKRKEIQVPEKVGKSRNTMFFQWFVAPEGRKVGSLKRRVRSQLVRWEMKNCTRLWREAHFQVKMYKTHHARSTFGSCDVEKVHAVVARSTFPSPTCKKLTGTEHFWTFRCAFAWQAQGIVHLVKSEQNVGFCSISKNDGRRGTFDEDLRRCMSRGRRSTKDMFIKRC